MSKYEEMWQSYRNYQAKMHDHRRRCGETLESVRKLMEQIAGCGPNVYFLSPKGIRVDAVRAINFDETGLCKASMAIQFQLPDSIPYALKVWLEIRARPGGILELTVRSGEEFRQFLVPTNPEYAKECVEWICSLTKRHFDNA